MTVEAIFLEISRHLLVRCVGFEKRPTPSVARQWVLWKAVFCIFNLHEPHLRTRSPICITCRQSSVIRAKYFFNQHRAIGELSIFAVIISCPRCSVCHVHLVALWIDHRVCSKHFVAISIISRLANIPFLVYQLKPVEILRALGVHSLRAGQDDDRKKKKCDTTGYCTVPPVYGIESLLADS